VELRKKGRRWTKEDRKIVDSTCRYAGVRLTKEYLSQAAGIHIETIALHYLSKS